VFGFCDRVVLLVVVVDKKITAVLVGMNHNMTKATDSFLLRFSLYTPLNRCPIKK
jgi:hypothetical protein